MEESNLKNQNLLLASLNCTNEEEFSRKNLYPPFKKIFKEVIIFDTKKNYFHYGKEVMNEKFLEILKKENPDYLFLDLGYDEFYLETLKKIKEISPKTTAITMFGDDNWRYEDFSRYYALFFDYIFISEKNYEDYEKDGLRNISFLHGANPEIFKPMNLKKQYDVTFIGMPIRDRPETIRYLIKQGIKIKVFGEGWSAYPDLKDFLGGCLNIKDYPKIINQSKINLNFSKTLLKGKKDTQMKGRIFEIPACKSFFLTEDFYRIKLYFKNLKKISFKTRKELLQKIKYYLEHEKEREKIAEEFYKETLKDYIWEKQFNNFFKKISKKKKAEIKIPPKINKKIILLSEKDFSLTPEKIKNKVKNLKNSDCIYFKTEQCDSSPSRVYFQAYSLEKSKKQISCCDYYLSSKNLGDYMLFMAKKAFSTIERQDFFNLLNINQLMVSKEFFLKNIKKFQKIFNGKKIDFINEENTVFVSIPLIKIKKINLVKQSSMNQAFKTKFIDKLFSLIYQKKIFSAYPYKLLLSGLFGNFFILKFLYSALSNKVNWEKLKAF